MRVTNLVFAPLIRKMSKRKLNGDKKHSEPTMFTYFPMLSGSDATPAGDQSHSEGVTNNHGEVC